MFKPFTRVISALELGSFIVKLQLGATEAQQLSYLFDGTEIINEIATGIQLLNEGNESALRDMIPDERYYRSFVSLSRELAPDGDQVKLVILSTSQTSINFTRTRDDIRLTPEIDIKILTEGQSTITVEGVLDHATSRQGNVLGLTTSNGNQYDIAIREGFDDMVRSYFKRVVIVTGIFDGKRIDPTDFKFSDQL